MHPQTIVRKPLLKAIIGNRSISAVDVREICLEPGQQAGRHLHPCTVVGYIAAGTALYQLEGEAVKTLPTGSVFHEPAGAVMANFGNASESEPMTFIAFHLLDGEQELVEMLNHN
jgi:quercetin dioxygenase-like cupin family protein